MSILNVNKSTSTDGIKKTIDKESEEVVLGILQKGIYAYPVKSTIRELISNAYDANIERETAKNILNGKDKIEDHYDLTKINGIYHASGWDPDYYDLNYLSDDPNVYLYYEEGPSRDVLRIKDDGIGLGKDRLVGYFKLGYSSKRTQKGSLGKWGLGNKSALSLGIDSYTVINRYNGKKFRFEVYFDNVVSTTPKFSNGKLNEFITVTVSQPTEKGDNIDKDFIFYYEDTEEVNGLELVVPVQKHYKKEFFRAIEEQLMYIPNVVFQVKKLNDIRLDTVDIAAKILYRDDNIVISESTLLNYPHILLGAGEGLINYGAVDFQALELEPKRGAVGLILDINDVEVTPSREAVVWSPKTRKAVISSYNQIVDTATKLINKELANAVDYWEWIQKAGSIKNALIKNQSSDGSVLQKLSGIIDASAINRIYYQKHNMNKLYTSDVKEIIGDKLLVRIFSYERYERKIKRVKIKSVNAVSGLTAFINDGPSDKYKDRYIYENVTNGNYVVIKRLDQWSTEKTSNLIGNSNLLLSYSDITVPEDIMDLYLKEEVDGDVFDDDESSTTTIDPNRLAKLRKLEQKILFHQARDDNGSIVYSSQEIKISDILAKYKDQIVVYGTFGERALMDSILGMFPYMIFDIVPSYKMPYSVNSTEIVAMYQELLNSKGIGKVNAILVSKDNSKYIEDKSNFQHISEFIIESYTDGKLVFNKIIRFVLTIKYIKKLIASYNIPALGKNLVDAPAIGAFYGKEFVQMILLSEIFSSSIVTGMATLVTNAVAYELGKGKVDLSTSQDYLETVDKFFPEELCDIVDEITDLHIIDTKAVEKAEEYCKFYSKYNPILREINYASDIDILEVLHPLVKHYEEFPKEGDYFQ